MMRLLRVGIIVVGATSVAASVAQTPEQLARLQRNTVKLAGNNYFNGVKCDAPAKLLEAYKEVAKHGYPMADFSAVWQR